MLILTKLPYVLVMITSIFAYKRIRSLGAGVKAKIVGGRDARIKDYPFMVRIEARVMVFLVLCGGSYIKPLWVLTAAHCVDVNDQTPQQPPATGHKDRIRCIMGLEKKGQKRLYQRVYSKDLFIHPMYFRNDTDLANDLGLIRLKESFHLNSVVQLIQMPAEEVNYSGEPVTLIGWGLTQPTDDIDKGRTTWPTKLQMLKTKVQNMQNCSKEMDSPSVICVGSKGKIACSGDSGGPLLYLNMLIGVCSYGFGCSEDMVVYENIYAHRQWIAQVTENQSRPEPTPKPTPSIPPVPSEKGANHHTGSIIIIILLALIFT